MKQIILEVLAGERMAVGVLEGDDLFLLLLLVRSGGCSGHRWTGGLAGGRGRGGGQLSDMSESRRE